MAKVARGRRVYPIEEIEMAKANGIAYATYRQRLYAGWGVKDATTVPVMTRSEIGRIMKNEYGIATRKIRDSFVKKGARV